MSYAYFDLATDRYRSRSAVPRHRCRSRRGARPPRPPRFRRALVHQDRPGARLVGSRTAVPDWVWLALLAAAAAAARRCGAGCPAAAAAARPAPTGAPRPRERGGGARRARRDAGARPRPALRAGPRRRRPRGRRRRRARRPGSRRCASGCCRGATDRRGPAGDDPRWPARLTRSCGGWADRCGRRRRAPALLLLRAGSPRRPRGPEPRARAALRERRAPRGRAKASPRRAAAEPAVAGQLVQPGRGLLPAGRAGAGRGGLAPGAPARPAQPSVRRALDLTPPPDATSAAGPGRPRSPPRSCCCWARWPGSPDGSGGSCGRGSASAGWCCWSSPGAGRCGGLALRAWYRRPLAIVLERRTLRLSPHGRAPAVAPLEGGSAVRVAGPDARAGSWCAPPAAARAGCPTRRSPRSAARFSPCRAASPSCPTPSPTRSPRARSSSAPRRW